MVNSQDNGPLTDTSTAADVQTRMPWRRVRKYLQKGLPFLVGIAAAFVGLYLYNFLFPPPDPLTTRDIETSITEALAAVTPEPPFSRFAYQTILPSIVFIETSDAAPTSGDVARAELDTPRSISMNEIAVDGANVENGHAHPLSHNLQQGDEDREENEADPVDIATGVVINTEGAILTALHVVESAGYINVTFADGTETEGVLVAAEPDNDIAVLAVEQLPETFAPAILGNPNAMRIGDEAYVVGNPLGLSGSMSAGVISGFDRSFTPTNLDYPLTRLIQFDAAVNPGTSGGPLLNRNGEVIGIVVALVNPAGQSAFSGIGLAVRIDEAAGGAGGAPPQ